MRTITVEVVIREDNENSSSPSRETRMTIGKDIPYKIEISGPMFRRDIRLLEAFSHLIAHDMRKNCPPLIRDRPQSCACGKGD